MRIAIYGVTGRVGPLIATEALSRGHMVTAVVRNPATLQNADPRMTVVVGDATDPTSIIPAVSGHDAVVVSISARKDDNHQSVVQAGRAMLAALPRASVKRLLWVGGTGSLEVTKGVVLLDTPEFPAMSKVGPAAAYEVYKLLKASKGALRWSFFSPALTFGPGPRTGKYRTSVDCLLKDANGASRISFEDYAVAVVDELEKQNTSASGGLQRTDGCHPAESTGKHG